MIESITLLFDTIHKSMTTIELVAAFFWLLCVYFTVKRSLWCWPTWIVQVTLYIYIFFVAKLYSDSLLQVIFLFMQFYGWYYWLYEWDRNEKNILKISTLSVKKYLFWIIVWISWSFLVGILMKTYTDASLPFLDASLAIASLIAQWLLSKKILENWIIWILVDIFSIGMYWYKELYITSGLYMIFLILATSGLISWYKAKKKQ